MVVTILEGTVPIDKFDEFAANYRAVTAGTLPPQMIETFLAHSAHDPSVWRIITIWHSREALEEYRKSVDTPGGILLFRSVGVEPNLLALDVAAHAGRAPQESAA
ncbi:antibiotic biosynthesis monooxygenase [Hoyosella sp. YIM 151337]|uniref:antibiotic biosynthesis monooxygenase n=1 Tax=Hoyosella sp. YIM 151337 TaxID=2992742 RepID=UPI002235C8DB|nr:antibiotic biosynthesis monooxygenase [Hoyosella sp. YIM 151337]MCW4352111.1 antibiotic biosynthesis monooxygenase [Hoyosella sp. YIM 151337]